MVLFKRAGFFFAFGSAASILFSIAVSQILLGLALAALLVSGAKLRFPPIGRPLALLVAITLAAVAVSADPFGGTPQIRKFFVFAILLVVYSTFDSIRQVRALVLTWSVAGLLSGAVAIAQFLQRRHEASDYAYVLDGRITGFAGHWMTFGGEEMIVLLMLASFLLFASGWRGQLAGWPVLGVLLAAITLGMTRCVYLLGVPAGMACLLWRRRRLLVVAALGAALIGAVVAPGVVKERAMSVLRPHGDMDSNAHRAVCRATGWEMIQAHPWLGLGPEQIGKQFDRYVPASVPRPLPHGWYGHLHNVYLQYAAERGVFGLLALLWFIGKAAADFLRTLRRSSLAPEVRAVLQGALATIAAILAEGLFEYNLGDSEVLTLFLSVIAAGYVAVRLAGETGAAERLQTQTREPAYAERA